MSYKHVEKRAHRERAQPLKRKRFGLLEKKKDYKQRANDHHRKRDTVRKLRQQAALRNPDEFYQRMITSRTRNGVHVEERDEFLVGGGTRRDREHRVVAMKAQDLAYLRHATVVEARKAEQLQAELHGLEQLDGRAQGAGEGGKPKHVVFLDTLHELEKFDPVQHLDVRTEDLYTRHNRPRLSKKQAKKAKLKEARASAGAVSTAADVAEARANAVEHLLELDELYSRESTGRKSKRSAKRRDLTSLADLLPIAGGDDEDEDEDEDGQEYYASSSSASAAVSRPHLYARLFPDEHRVSQTRRVAATARLVADAANAAAEAAQEEVEELEDVVVPQKLKGKLEKKRQRNYRKLQATVKRKRKLGDMARDLERQAHLSKNGKVRKTVTRDRFGDIDHSKTVYKWKKERKR